MSVTVISRLKIQGAAPDAIADNADINGNWRRVANIAARDALATQYLSAGQTTVLTDDGGSGSPALWALTSTGPNVWTNIPLGATSAAGDVTGALSATRVEQLSGNSGTSRVNVPSGVAIDWAANLTISRGGGNNVLFVMDTLGYLNNGRGNNILYFDSSATATDRYVQLCRGDGGNAALNATNTTMQLRAGNTMVFQSTQDNYGPAFIADNRGGAFVTARNWVDGDGESYVLFAVGDGAGGRTDTMKLGRTSTFLKHRGVAVLDATVGAGTVLSGADNGVNLLKLYNNLVSAESHRIVNVTDPSNAQDAATKAYVDSVAAGLSPRPAARVVSTANIASLSGTTMIDSVAVVAGNRVLLTGQSTATQNGVWVVASGAWTRPADFAAASSAASAFFFVQEGTVYADTGWVCTNNVGSDVVGTNNLAFVQFSSAGVITAGNGLTKTGNSLAVTAADGSIVVSGSGVAVGVLQNDTMHGARGGGTQHSLANNTAAGFTASLGGTANRVLLTTDGTAQSWGQIVNAQVSSTAAIGREKIEGIKYLSRAVPTTVGNYIEIGNYNLASGARSILVAITVATSGFATTKVYALALAYGSGSGIAVPISDGGAYSGQDFELEVTVATTTATLRIVRTAGVTAGTALVTLQNLGSQSDVFTATTATGTSTIVGEYASARVYDHDNLTAVSGHYSGWASRTTTTVTTTAGTRTFQIAPTGASFDFYVMGRKFSKSAAQSVVWPDVDGIHFFYFDTAGTLQTTQTLATWEAVIFGQGGCPVWALHWNATLNVIDRSLEERHNARRVGEHHYYAHTFFGTQWVSGLALSGFTIGNGSLATHGQFSVDNGVIADEDIQTTIADGSPQDLAPTAQLPVFYLSGASATPLFKAANSTPFIASGEAGYTGAGGARPAYNQFTGGAWQLTEVANNDYFHVHVIATPDATTPVIAWLGQATYTTLGAAQAAASSAAAALSGPLALLSTEYKILGTVIYQAGTVYAAPKGRVVQTAEGANYVDFRTAKLTGSSAAITAHGALSGLGTDDHVQYALLAGRASGQTLIGGTGASEHLTLQSTANATRGEVRINDVLLTFPTAILAPIFRQNDQTAGSTNGQPLTVQAQNATGATSTGGELRLTSGTGTTAAGNVVLQTGGATKLTVAPTYAQWGVSEVIWGNTLAPWLYQNDVTTASATGAMFHIQAQNATGTTSVGGELRLSTGSGTSVPGTFTVRTGPVTRLQVDGATGNLRMNNLGYLVGRNFAGTADVAIARVAADDTVEFGPGVTDRFAVTDTEVTAGPFGANNARLVTRDLVGADTYAALYLTIGGTSLLTTNYALAGNAVQTMLNVPAGGTTYFRIGNISYADLTASRLALNFNGLGGAIILQNLVGSATMGAVYMGGVTPSSTNYALKCDGLETTLNSVSSSMKFNVVSNTLRMELSSLALILSVADIRFNSTVVSPKLFQLDDATNSITGDTLLVQAQNATGTTTTGGNLELRSGTGTTANGQVKVMVGATDVLTVKATSTAFEFLLKVGTAAPPTPPSGYVTTYALATGVYMKFDNGSVTQVAAP